MKFPFFRAPDGRDGGASDPTAAPRMGGQVLPGAAQPDRSDESMLAPDSEPSEALPFGAGAVTLAPPVTAAQGQSGPTKIAARDVSVFYGDKQALFDVNLDIPDKTVTALIGP